VRVFKSGGARMSLWSSWAASRHVRRSPLTALALMSPRCTSLPNHSPPPKPEPAPAPRGEGGFSTA
jgi:hypothetical protein